MSALVTNGYAIQQNAILAAIGDNAQLTALIAQASDMIQKFCGRVFAVTNYTEYLSGGPQPYQTVILKQFPVTQITRVATQPTTVLTVSNTLTSVNQRATVATTLTGVVCYTMASAVPTTTTLLYATYPTLAALATAIVNLGNGWNAVVANSYDLFPSADMRVLQGAVTCLGSNQAYLESYIEEIAPYGFVGGSMGTNGWGYLNESNAAWRLDPGTGILKTSFWPQGVLNIRVDYTAGFTTIPDALQAATVEVAKNITTSGANNPFVTQEKLGPQSQTTDGAQFIFTKTVMNLISGFYNAGPQVLDFT